MAQRMVMDTRFLTLKELKMFVEEAEKLELPMSSTPSVTSYEVEAEVEEGQEPLPPRVYFKFSLPIPDSKRRRFVKVKKKTKIEKAVEEQIAEHKKEVKNGKKVAHVPPVKGTVKKKAKKKRAKKEETPEQVVETPVLTEEQTETHPRRKKSKPTTTAYKTEKMENADV